MKPLKRRREDPSGEGEEVSPGVAKGDDLREKLKKQRGGKGGGVAKGEDLREKLRKQRGGRVVVSPLREEWPLEVVVPLLVEERLLEDLASIFQPSSLCSMEPSLEPSTSPSINK